MLFPSHEVGVRLEGSQLALWLAEGEQHGDWRDDEEVEVDELDGGVIAGIEGEDEGRCDGQEGNYEIVAWHFYDLTLYVFALTDYLNYLGEIGYSEARTKNCVTAAYSDS